MKILLLTDTTMNPNAGGINQTLYNLFSFSVPEDILCVTSKKIIKMVPPSDPFTNRYITYHFEIIPATHNRFSKYFNPLIDWFNFSYNNAFRSFKKVKRQIAAFKPDVVISCPNGPVGVFIHHKLIKDLHVKNVIPYFMDDWMYRLKLKWFGGEIHHSIKNILSNKSWLMISKELAGILQERYKVSPQNLLPIHNPVDISNAPDAIPLINKKEYTLAYAGALWQMHYDSFYAMANSINQLRDQLNIKLICYTSIIFWDWRKTELEALGVSYGGQIPYKDIHSVLARADALLVCSSFSKEWYTHSKGSVQTKITDYLKARRLIISCGPDYSANHKFIKKHDCGICIETNDPIVIKDQIKNIFYNIERYQNLVDNGWQLLENEYTFNKAHEKLKHFLKEVTTERV